MIGHTSPANCGWNERDKSESLYLLFCLSFPQESAFPEPFMRSEVDRPAINAVEDELAPALRYHGTGPDSSLRFPVTPF